MQAEVYSYPDWPTNDAIFHAYIGVCIIFIIASYDGSWCHDDIDGIRYCYFYWYEGEIYIDFSEISVQFEISNITA